MIPLFNSSFKNWYATVLSQLLHLIPITSAWNCSLLQIFIEKYETLSIMNEEIFSCPLHENLRVTKFLESGTTYFHQVSISSNDFHSCFYPIISFQKVNKHPYGSYLNNMTLYMLDLNSSIMDE